MEPGGFCRAREMSLMDSPALHRAHNSFLPVADNPPGRDPASPLLHLRFGQHRKSTVLHRPVEPTAAFFAREEIGGR
jgi:hypothetical protein